MAQYSPLARDVRNNGGAVLHGGASATSINASFGAQPMTTKTTLVANSDVDRQQTNKPKLPTGTTGSSGNLGTWRANSGALFNQFPARNGVIAKGLMGQFIAGTSGINFFAAAETVFRPTTGNNRFYGYQRLGITGWSYTTGAATYSANRGATVLASGFDGKTGQRADDAANPSNAIPGELVYMYGNYYPSAADYQPRKNP